MKEWSQGITWSTDLETGHYAIDSQHKELFKLTSNLVEACENDKGQEVLGKTLDFLASYTIKHFGDEEELQIKYNFPDYERHKKLHDDFKAKAVELIDRYKQDSDLANLRTQVNSVIVRWLLQHIRGEDFKVAEHIRKNNGSK
jgi:hemerythrin